MQKASKKVTLTGHIDVPSADLGIVQAELPKHIQLSRAEPGCLVFNVVPDPLRKNRFVVYEEFVNEDAFNFHQERVMASEWGTIAINVKRNYCVHRG